MISEHVKYCYLWVFMNRKNVIFKNVSLGVVYKALNMCMVYLSIPLLLNYLGKEEYGLWVTIFSVVSMVYVMDVGIGNGLKNKLTTTLSNNNHKSAREYISTAYVLVSFMSLVLLAIGALFIYNLDLQSLLSTSIDEVYLKKTLFITLVLILVSFVLNLYKSFYYATQNAAKTELSLFVYQAIILLSIIFALTYLRSSLLYVAIIYGSANTFIGIVFTVLFFYKNRALMPSLIFYNKEKVQSLMGIGIGFFLIQLSMIVIFATDNIIISKLLGPEEVTNYDIVNKLFQVVIVVSVILQNPLWPLYTNAYQKKDFNWIRKTLKRLNMLFIGFVVMVILLGFLSHNIISLWISERLVISNRLIIFMGVFVIVRVFGSIYMYFLNGIGKIKLQLWLYAIGALINIPLSVYFVKYLNLGSSGVILGTIVCILGMTIALPIQTYKILRRNEHG